MTCGHPERPILVLSRWGCHTFATKSHRACYHYFTFHNLFYLVQMTPVGLFLETWECVCVWKNASSNPCNVFKGTGISHACLFMLNIFHMIIKESKWAPRATKPVIFSVLLREWRGRWIPLSRIIFKIILILLWRNKLLTFPEINICSFKCVIVKMLIVLPR